MIATNLTAELPLPPRMICDMPIIFIHPALHSHRPHPRRDADFKAVATHKRRVANT